MQKIVVFFEKAKDCISSQFSLVLKFQNLHLNAIDIVIKHKRIFS